MTEILCECQSGKPALECCSTNLLEAVLHPKEINPPAPKSGYAHPKCYLNSTFDCSRQISREHPLSLAILELLSIGGAVRVKGAPWLAPGESKRVGPTGLASKVLCERHNNALSDLDGEGKRFIEAIRSFAKLDCYARDSIEVFNGIDIERFFLKVLLGFVAGVGFATTHGHRASFSIDRKVCTELLYPASGFVHGQGLFCTAARRASFAPKDQIKVLPAAKSETDRLVGIWINTWGFDFLLSICPLSDVEDRNTVYRPSYLVFRRESDAKFIYLLWPGVQDEKIITWSAQWARSENERNTR